MFRPRTVFFCCLIHIFLDTSWVIYTKKWYHTVRLWTLFLQFYLFSAGLGEQKKIKVVQDVVGTFHLSFPTRTHNIQHIFYLLPHNFWIYRFPFWKIIVILYLKFRCLGRGFRYTWLLKYPKRKTSRGVISRDTSDEGIGLYSLIRIDQLGNIAVSNGARRRSVLFFWKYNWKRWGRRGCMSCNWAITWVLVVNAYFLTSRLLLLKNEVNNDVMLQ